MSKTEAKELINKLYTELEQRWEQSALMREEQHEHYGPCYECEEEYDAMLRNFGIKELEHSLRYLAVDDEPMFVSGSTDYEIEVW